MGIEHLSVAEGGTTNGGAGSAVAVSISGTTVVKGGATDAVGVEA